jgi:hypothetical protein
VYEVKEVIVVVDCGEFFRTIDFKCTVKGAWGDKCIDACFTPLVVKHFSKLIES